MPPFAQGIVTESEIGTSWLTVNVSAAALADTDPNRTAIKMSTASSDKANREPFIVYLLVDINKFAGTPDQG
jgi:hypothetical protein